MEPEKPPTSRKRSPKSKKKVGLPAGSPDVIEQTGAEKIDKMVPMRGCDVPQMVGLGGSAGGIEALQAFFKAMAPDSGMVFVVILHLSPDHVSTLAEMFQRSTTMPVVTATDGVKVAANCVYVIPPGKLLSSTNGRLRLTDSEHPTGRRTAVDIFFRTLADSHGPSSVAIVLSGADGDGAIGIKRIKEHGGLTIAQDPNEAQHSSMPRAAIATGMVDWVLRVQEIPAQLLAYRARGKDLRLPTEDGPHPAQPATPAPDESEVALRDIIAFLHTRTACDFSYYKRATILRRIARRMQVNGIDDLPGYLIHLRTHTGEAGALLQDLLISVTNFFRDREAFDALAGVIPELFRGKGPGDTVRVWVAACATGEEAYSVAMLLCEYARELDAPPQLQVFATDLDDDVIRNAREGFYPETISTDVSEGRLRRFFVHEALGYRIRREVREIVLFTPHDLLKDSPFSRLDLISCRNLLIYLNRDAQTRAMEVFHFALRPGGRLFLGTSETVEDGSEFFDVADKKHRIYMQRPGPRPALKIPTGLSTVARALELQERSRERPAVPRFTTDDGDPPSGDEKSGPPLASGVSASELHYHLIERLSPPSILVNAAHEIVHVSESASRFLQYSAGEPTRNLLRMVHPSLRIELRATLYAAAQTHQPATALGVSFEGGEEREAVDLLVNPVDALARDFLLVVFTAQPAGKSAGRDVVKSAQTDHVAQRLEQALETTKTQLRETIEQSEASTEELKASNEELQAMNEELRSATEELESSREELNSINEELSAVNLELTSKVDELGQANSDLQSLMSSTDIATVFLDRELRINRFTPSARELFNFIPTDLGRPLADLSRKLDYPEIVADAEQALARLKPTEREVSEGERFFIARTLPYRTTDDRIAGVVLTFLDITTRKAAEEKLRQSEQQLADFFDHATVGLHWVGPDGIILRANQTELNLLGYTRNEYIGRDIADFHADRTVIDDILRKLSGGEELHDYPARLRCKDGSIRDVLISSNVLWEDGRFVHTRCFTRDITDRKRAEEALRESEERYRTLFASAPMAVFACDQNAVIQHYNARAVELWGREPVCGVEQHCGSVKLWLPDGTFLPHTQSPMVEMLRTGIPVQNVEVFIERPDGSRLPVLVNFAALKDVQGKITGAITSFIDLTERKATEEELRQSEARKDAVLRIALDAIVTIDHEGNFVEFNPAAERIFGYARADVIGRPMAELIIPHRLRVRHHAGLAHYLATGEGPVLNRQIEVSALRADGTEFPAELAIIPVPGSQPPLFTAFMRDITERKRDEEAMSRLAALVESSDDGLFGQDLNGIITSWNRGAEQIFGYRTDEIVGTPVMRLVPAEAQAEERELQRKIAAGERVGNFETMRQAKDGRQFPVSITVSPLKDGDGKVIGASKVVRDISSHKAAEAIALTAHRRLQNVLGSITDGLAVLDKDWRYTYFSEQAARIVGVNAADLLGGFLWDLFPAAEGTKFYEGYHRAVNTGQKVEFEEYYPEPINKWLECHCYPSDEGLSVYFHDVTARKQAEETLRQNEALFSTLIEQAPMGVYVVDAQFRMQQVNPLAEPVFSKVRPLIGRDFTEVMETCWGPEVGGEVARLFRHTLDTGERYISPPFVHPRFDLGVEQAYDWETQRMILPDGTHGVVCYFTDVTEQRRTETALLAAKEAAESASQSKDRFLAVLSHELRTPLTPVLMAVGGLAKDASLRPDVRDAFAMIKRNIELETKLIDDLLDLSRITSGKVEMKIEAVDLNEAVRQVCEMCRPQMVEREVRLETVFDQKIGTIAADSSRLQQVIWNVVKNAVKFSPAQGLVRVSTARLSSERCEVRVHDEGIGIPPDVLPRIFAAFEQGDAHITRQFGGLGLGLAISRALIDLQGGAIRAESAGQGKGATFIIELPGDAATPAPLRPPAHPVKSAGLEKPRLLLVEDHADTADMLSQLLRAAGITVLNASDVAGAIALAKKEPIDLLISDLGLPDGSGYEVMRAIRAHRPVPGIAMSGYGMEEDIRRSREEGFSAHLIKPVDISELLATVHRLAKI